MKNYNPSEILYAKQGNTFILKFNGDIDFLHCSAVEQFIEKLFADYTEHWVIIDLSDVKKIDSTTLGLIAKIGISHQEYLQGKPVIVLKDTEIKAMLIDMDFERLFDISLNVNIDASDLQPLDGVETTDKKKLAKRVLQAHEILSEISERNRLQFKEVIAAMEKTIKR